MPKLTPKLGIIGECMLELSGYQGLSQPVQFNYGGDTLNTAIYYARLSQLPVYYITAIGQDPFSAAMLSAWQQEHINTQYCLQIKDQLPGLYAIETDANGERQFHFWREQAPVKQLFYYLAEQKKLDAIKQLDQIYLTGISLSRWDDKQCELLWSLLEAYHDKTIIFDLNYRASLWSDKTQAIKRIEKLLTFVDVFLPGLDDIQALWGISDVDQILAYFNRFNCHEVLLKRQSQAAILSVDNKVMEIKNPMLIAKPLDTTAAGDSFNAAYIAARNQGLTYEQAVEAGHRCAATVIQHRGAIIPQHAMEGITTCLTP